MANREEKGCQTDEDLIYNYAWTKFYYHFQNHASGQTDSKQAVSIPDVEMTDGSAKTEANTAATTAVSERLDADAIKKIAEESLEARGFMYEPSTGLYYDTQNDLFYDQETQLYLDIVNRINYKFVLNERTNTYQLRYDSKMNRSECKRLRSYLKRSDLFEVDESKSSSTVTTKETTQGDKEEGEESASISSSSSSSSSSKRRRHRHKSKKSKKLKKHKSKKKKKKSSDNKSDESGEDEIEKEEEEGEEEEEEEIIDLANQYPPCIRAILIEYDQDDEDDEIKLGSLFIVPYTGGAIGKASKCIVSFPKLKEIENEHVTIEYDMKKKIYFIKDLNSKLGTFINKTKIEADRIVEIKHGDEVNLSDVVTLLIHIHWGSNSCPNCEPGEVMSRFKQEKERLEREMNLLNLTREEARKETLKSIKKKYNPKFKPRIIYKINPNCYSTLRYGLKFNDFDKPTASNQGYKDRAAERRNQLGVDTNTNQATTSKASVHVAIGESNVGHKMLQKMGWKQGQGLGKKEEGITEPISTNVKLDNSGLGSNANTQCSMDMDERQKRKIIALKKTQERYHQSSN